MCSGDLGAEAGCTLFAFWVTSLARMRPDPTNAIRSSLLDADTGVVARAVRAGQVRLS